MRLRRPSLSFFIRLLFPLGEIVRIVGNLVQPLERSSPELDVGNFLAHSLGFYRLHQEQAAEVLNTPDARLFREGLRRGSRIRAGT